MPVGWWLETTVTDAAKVSKKKGQPAMISKLTSFCHGFAIPLYLDLSKKCFFKCQRHLSTLKVNFAISAVGWEEMVFTRAR